MGTLRNCLKGLIEECGCATSKPELKAKAKSGDAGE